MLLVQRTALRDLTSDGWLLFLTRFTRLFAYGSLSVVLILYLTSLGLDESQTGVLLTLTLVGDTIISLWLTTRADRIGRRRVLQLGAVLMAGAELDFASTGNLLLLIIAGVLVQTSNWPNLLRRYAGSELGGHHSGPDCGHGRRPVRQLADLELFLPDFRCQFNSADRHRRRIEALEAQHRSDPLFYTAVVLFDSVIEILARTDTHSFGDRPRSLQLPNGTMRGRICIQRDDARRSVSLHRLLKETFGCSDVPLRREQEIHVRPCLSTAP